MIIEGQVLNAPPYRSLESALPCTYDLYARVYKWVGARTVSTEEEKDNPKDILDPNGNGTIVINLIRVEKKIRNSFVETTAFNRESLCSLFRDVASIISEKHFSKTIVQIKVRICLNVFHFKSDIILFSRKKFKELGIEFGYSPALINSVIEWVTRGGEEASVIMSVLSVEIQREAEDVNHPEIQLPRR